MDRTNRFGTTANQFALRLTEATNVRLLIDAIITELSDRCEVAAASANYNNDVDLYIARTDPDHPDHAHGRFVRCRVADILRAHGIAFLGDRIKREVRKRLLEHATGATVTIKLKRVMHRKRLYPTETTAEVFSTRHGVFLIETADGEAAEENGFSVLKKIERKTSA